MNVFIPIKTVSLKINRYRRTLIGIRVLLSIGSTPIEIESTWLDQKSADRSGRAPIPVKNNRYTNIFILIKTNIWNMF